MNGQHERADEPPVGDEQSPPKQESYPTFAATEADRHRWDLAMAVAAQLLDEPMASPHTRFAAAALFHDRDLPTE